jgi:hypothetical protein
MDCLSFLILITPEYLFSPPTVPHFPQLFSHNVGKNQKGGSTTSGVQNSRGYFSSETVFLELRLQCQLQVDRSV